MVGEQLWTEAASLHRLKALHVGIFAFKLFPTATHFALHLAH
jgi:hypothetical protein